MWECGQNGWIFTGHFAACFLFVAIWSKLTAVRNTSRKKPSCESIWQFNTTLTLLNSKNRGIQLLELQQISSISYVLDKLVGSIVSALSKSTLLVCCNEVGLELEVDKNMYTFMSRKLNKHNIQVNNTQIF